MCVCVCVCLFTIKVAVENYTEIIRQKQSTIRSLNEQLDVKTVHYAVHE